MVGVEEGLEFRFCGDLYSQESTFPLVLFILSYLIVYCLDLITAGGQGAVRAATVIIINAEIIFLKTLLDNVHDKANSHLFA